MAKLATDVDYSIRAATLADAPMIGHVHVLSWRQSYAGMLPAAMLARMSVAEHGIRWARMLGHGAPAKRARVHVVEDTQGTIIGFGSFGPQRLAALRNAGFDAEVDMLYFLRAAQRQGLGTRLMRTMASALSDSGYRGLSLWVLNENVAARGFYERLGGQPVGERPYGRLVEIAYGWPALRTLIT